VALAPRQPLALGSLGCGMSAIPIETRYAACRFRSRLEARWAVFFDSLGIPWQYEPQGFFMNGRNYLPDFFLTDCSTWVEVKGDEGELDHSLMLTAAERLPVRRCKGERGPRLLILGPIPEPSSQGDLGWVGISVSRISYAEVRDGDHLFNCTIYSGELEPRFGRWECECGCVFADEEGPGAGSFCNHLSALYYGESAVRVTKGATIESVTSEVIVQDQWWGFGRYHENLCLSPLTNTSQATPVSLGEGNWLEAALDPYEDTPRDLAGAYAAARSARFEHGERRRRRR